MTDKYAVFGNPIAHSKSPDIHRQFAEQTGQDLSYSKQLVADDGFEAAADAFFASGGKGLNITVPFKQNAYAYVARTTPRARRAGAVNTLSLEADGTILGDTTDGVGLVSDIINNLGWEIRHKRVLVLGAGGAVRGVLEPLLAQQPQHIVIANRTVDKALQLSKGFAEFGYLLGCGFDMLDEQQFDLIINGTSAGLQGDLPPLPDSLIDANGATACYDMLYGAKPTPFMQWAAQRGAKVSDGLGMLVGQAAESFALWRGMRPETAAVIASLRAQLGD
ncbi:shikimate dehydrogenase [Porticoccaceae bacterium]|jgi:shikimate dehydrogenase|nr:shikimate dehydrogenase [Porticoccaceae bacterium]MDA9014074.1 shikimate dehydrogenase [Porticoccaceae bacterium]